jgi:hypothetical protein
VRKPVQAGRPGVGERSSIDGIVAWEAFATGAREWLICDGPIGTSVLEGRSVSATHGGPGEAEGFVRKAGVRYIERAWPHLEASHR